MSGLDREALRLLALAARFPRYNPRHRLGSKTTKPWPTARDLDRDGFAVWFGDPPDDAYIAALSPSTVLGLLAALSRLELVAEAARAYVDDDDENLWVDLVEAVEALQGADGVAS